MHTFIEMGSSLVAGLVIGLLYGNRAKAAVEAELNLLRKSAAGAIAPKQ